MTQVLINRIAKKGIVVESLHEDLLRRVLCVTGLGLLVSVGAGEVAICAPEAFQARDSKN
jgi:hypothetical protein